MEASRVEIKERLIDQRLFLHLRKQFVANQSLRSRTYGDAREFMLPHTLRLPYLFVICRRLWLDCFLITISSKQLPKCQSFHVAFTALRANPWEDNNDFRPVARGEQSGALQGADPAARHSTFLYTDNLIQACKDLMSVTLFNGQKWAQALDKSLSDSF